MPKKAKDRFPGSPRCSERVHTVSGIVPIYEGSSDLTFVRSPDVSTSGMFINTSRSFPQGAILNVRFRLALPGASLRVRGEVRYSLPGVGIGVEFVGLEPAALKLLGREVNCGSAAAHIPKRSGAPQCKPKRSQRPRVATKRRRSRS